MLRRIFGPCRPWLHRDVEAAKVYCADGVCMAVILTFMGLAPPTESWTVRQLRELKPLPMVHYSWPLSRDFLDNPSNDALLAEYVRISRAACLWGEFATQEQIKQVAGLIRAANSVPGGPRPATMGFTFRPWSRMFPPKPTPPTYTGPEAAKEVDYFEKRLTLVSDWAEAAGVQVSAIILECERFEVKPDDSPGAEAWNAAIDEKHNLIHDAVKRIVPGARVRWYARGLSKLFTLRERGDTFSIPLYNTPDIAWIRRAYTRAVAKADLHGVDEVTPWIALGAAYIVHPDGTKTWDFDNDYDKMHSYSLGAEVVNRELFGARPERYAPWNRATRVIFWPSPSDVRVKDWWGHFIAYTRGVHEVP